MAEDPKKAGAKLPAKTETETVVLGADGQRAELPKAAPRARVCEPTDRAGDGLRRYKLRLDGHPSGARSQTYVLAESRDAAQAEYLRHLGVEASSIKDDVRVAVTELPD